MQQFRGISKMQRRIKIRGLSGNVDDNRKLVAFLYLLMRDKLPCGEVEKIVQEVNDGALRLSGFDFSNGWLAQYAQSLADFLEEQSE